MRLVFISSVTAMTPLRTISTITGSRARRFGGRLVVLRAMAPTLCERSPDGAQRHPGPALPQAEEQAPDVAPLHPGYGSLFPDRDGEIAEAIDRERVAGGQHRRRRVLLDQRRAPDAVAGGERRAGKRAGVDESGSFALDPPLAGHLRLG